MRTLLCLWLGVCVLSSQVGAAGELPRDSIYHLSSTWKDQNNSSFKLQQLRGKKVLIGMVYTKCPHACPMTIGKIQAVERKLKDLKAKGYHIVLASFDPERDTPAHLKKYMASRTLSEKDWTFLSAPNDATARELAIVLGINYKKLEDGEFSHSNILSVLNEDGVRVAKIESLKADIDPLVEALTLK